MAISFLQQPTGIYPAYNDSWIKFFGDLEDTQRAEITIYPTSLFPRVFTIFPDADQNYLFNLIDVMRVVFNQNGFEDQNPNQNGSLNGMNIVQQVKLRIYAGDFFEEGIFTWDFYRGIHQVDDERELVGKNQELLFPDSDLQYYYSLNWWEGFPLFFDIKRIENAGDTVTLENTTTGETSYPILTATQSKKAFRISIDDVDGSWNVPQDPPFLWTRPGLNFVKVKVNNVQIASLSVRKREVCNGLYLKWFNEYGSYSFYLFERFYNSSLNSKGNGRIFSNQFKNVGEYQGNRQTIGKSARKTLSARAKYDARDHQLMESLLKSPFVQLWSREEPFQDGGKWINVFVEGNLTFNNKKAKNDAFITIEMPAVLTSKL